MGSCLVGTHITSAYEFIVTSAGREFANGHQTIVSEIFPLSIRARGASIGASSNWLNNFAIALFVPSMFAGWAWGTYIFFAVFLLGGFVSKSSRCLTGRLC